MFVIIHCIIKFNTFDFLSNVLTYSEGIHFFLKNQKFVLTLWKKPKEDDVSQKIVCSSSNYSILKKFEIFKKTNFFQNFEFFKRCFLMPLYDLKIHYKSLLLLQTMYI